MAQHFKDLIVWQRAMDLVVDTYRVTESFPSVRCMALLIKFVERQYRSRATSQKAKRISAKRSLFTFFGTQAALLRN